MVVRAFHSLRSLDPAGFRPRGTERGLYVAGNYAGCVWCRAPEFVLCEACRTLNCSGALETGGETRSHFTCGSCATRGKVGEGPGEVDEGAPREGDR